MSDHLDAFLISAPSALVIFFFLLTLSKTFTTFEGIPLCSAALATWINASVPTSLSVDIAFMRYGTGSDGAGTTPMLNFSSTKSLLLISFMFKGSIIDFLLPTESEV